MRNLNAGQKRICAQCAARFFDLNRSPIICPTCGTEFIVPLPPPSRPPRAPRKFQYPAAGSAPVDEIAAFDSSHEKSEDEAGAVMILDEDSDNEAFQIDKGADVDPEKRDRET